MVREGKSKPEGGEFQVYRRPYTRNQAKIRAVTLSPTPVPMDSPSESLNLLSLSNCASPYKWRKCAKRSVPTKNISVKKLGKSMDETIAETEDLNNHKQADQPLSSPASGDVPAGLSNTFALMLPPAPVVPCSAPALETNVPAVDTFGSNITPSKKARIEEVKEENSITEDCPGDNIVGFQQGNETNLGITDIIDMYADNGSTEDVASSASSSAFVSVGGYKVKKVSAPMLRSIIKKYGDIAVDCSAPTIAGRSMFLQMICDIMQTLEDSEIVDMAESAVEHMLDEVKELAQYKLQVGWLQKRLEEILNTIKELKDCPKLKKAKDAIAKSIEESEKALQCYKDEMLDHKAKMRESELAIQALEKKAFLEQDKLVIAKAEYKGIKAKVLSFRHRVETFTKGSLTQDLC